MLKRQAAYINIFTDEELFVFEKISTYLLTIDSSLHYALLQQKTDLEQLALVVDRSPSPKVVLGYEYMVSKLHFFGFILKLTVNNPDLCSYQNEVEEIYTDIMFSIMAEELYKSILQTCSSTDPLTRFAADELIRHWENRFEVTKNYFAHHIRDLWSARQKIVPVLGTLQGTIELMRLNFLLSPVWNRFLANEGSNTNLTYALEEFIFDLSFEEIDLLKNYMQKNQIAAVDRKNAEEILINLLHLTSEEVTSRKQKNEQPSAVQLYLSFFKRRANSLERRKNGSPETFRTLEEYFFRFLYGEKIS